jgi:hypothetical protein
MAKKRKARVLETKGATIPIEPSTVKGKAEVDPEIRTSW